MAVKLNTEFNYRCQVIGDTAWEKIKTLKGFLEGRVRAAKLEQVAKLKYQSMVAKLKRLESESGLQEDILDLKADIIEIESNQQIAYEAHRLNEDEIKILNKLLNELYVIAEPTRIKGYTDEEMFEVNAANEFTVNIARDIQAEMIANGRPSAAKIRNAMSNPYTWGALKEIGMIPKESKLLEGHVNPVLKIELTGVEDEVISDGEEDSEPNLDNQMPRLK